MKPIIKNITDNKIGLAELLIILVAVIIIAGGALLVSHLSGHSLLAR